MTEREKTDSKLPELLTLKEAGSFLKVHVNTLRQWDAKGILPAIRLGEKGIRRYKKESLMKFLDKKT